MRGKKNSYQWSCNWTHSVRLEKDSAFVNININIPHNLCGAVSVNWGLPDWFSFLTRAVERQFNFFFFLPPGRLYIYIYFCAFLSKKCQHDFVSTKHILCCDRYHLTPIYERHRRDTFLQHNMNILSSHIALCSGFENYIWRMCRKSKQPSLK